MCASLFPHPLFVYSGHVVCDAEVICGRLCSREKVSGGDTGQEQEKKYRVLGVDCHIDYQMLYGQTYYSKKNKDQPGNVSDPARGQLNREKYYFPVPVLA